MFSRFLVVMCLDVAATAAMNDFEVVEHLNKLNKPSMKSIKSPDGDIIDCVHISNQAAFDHPSLKNHKIQMRPNYHPEGMNFDNMKVSSENQETITQLWHLNGKCAKGTIPVRRTKKEDVLRASSIKKYGKKKSVSSVAQPTFVDLDLINQSGHQHAIAYVEGEFYGAKATMNVWEPQIQ
ncbi:protein neprosin-like [Bidens hawaiensis]|uniref:protein neprosin-like n=1 Tax=Bidens hawaiensis TaxID=980011 RepID=UPI00404991BB